jgi:hypothetical protein
MEVDETMCVCVFGVNISRNPDDLDIDGWCDDTTQEKQKEKDRLFCPSFSLDFFSSIEVSGNQRATVLLERLYKKVWQTKNCKRKSEDWDRMLGISTEDGVYVQMMTRRALFTLLSSPNRIIIS